MKGFKDERFCDDHLKAFFLSGMCIFKKHIRFSVCGNDPHIKCHSQLLKYISRFPHNRHIRVTAHNYTDLSHKTPP